MSITLNGTTGITTPPVTWTSQSLAGTPTAGQMEYDGTSSYFTPLGTQRGIVPGMQFYRLNTSNAGSNVNTAQNIFGVGCTLSSSTIYAFEIVSAWSKTAGTTSHGMTFSFGGTASVGQYTFIMSRGSSATSLTDSAATTNSLYAQANSLLVTTSSAVVSATVHLTARIAGTLSVTTGGTLIPQYTLSAAPGGAYTVAAGSYMLIYPIAASGANVNVGTWA